MPATGGARRGKDFVDGAHITSRALDLVVPNMGTSAQRAALQKLVTYGQSKGVTVNIIVFP